METTPEIKFIPGSLRLGDVGKDLAKLYPPHPASKIIPEWYKKLPKIFDTETPPIRSAKTCPGIHDFLRAGYIIPAWSDMVFYYDPELEGTENEVTYIRAPAIQNTLPPVLHSKKQLDQCPIFHGTIKPFQKIIKIKSPWYIESPENISVLYIQPYYRLSTDYSILPGIIDPWVEEASNRQLNVFIELHAPKKEIRIKAGEPLVQAIPFRRENFAFTVEDTEETEEKYRLMELEVNSTLSRLDDVDRVLPKHRSSKNKNYDIKGPEPL